MRNLLMTKFGNADRSGTGKAECQRRVVARRRSVGPADRARLRPLALLRLRLRRLILFEELAGRCPLVGLGLVGRVVAAVVSAPASSAGTGPPSSTFWIGALSSGSWIASGGVPGRHVDRGHDLLAADQRDGDRAQLGKGRECGQAEAGDETAPPSALRRGSSASSLVNLACTAGAPSIPAPVSGAGTLPQEMVTLPTGPPACNAEPSPARRQSSRAAAVSPASISMPPTGS